MADDIGREGGAGSGSEVVTGDADFVVVANRLPVHATTAEDGTVTWSPSPGGLVTALAPVLAERSGTWVGWDGRIVASPDGADGTAGPRPAAAGDAALDAATDYELHNVPLTQEDLEEYYEGFANSTLWPLYHDAIVAPEYHRHTWDAYRTVNERFARATAEVAASGAIVWVQDYHLQLVPGMLRTLRPDLRIGFFLHIPFPPIELFLQMPWRRQVIEGLLGADVVGFHVPLDKSNFMTLAERLAGVPHADDDGLMVPGAYGARRVTVGAFPISIDTAGISALAESDVVARRAQEIREEVGDPKLLLLGVDRLDYTKGIDVRLRAYEEMLDEGTLDPATTVLLQIATPSREGVGGYQDMRDEIELIVGRITGTYSQVGTTPVVYLHQNLPREELLAFYRAADIMLVTPRRDGMNLVAKEYVAARVDECGALVLSEFTGAAEELRSAWLVNPYDMDGLKETISAATRATESDQNHRMRIMRSFLFRHDVHRWAADFLGALDG